MGRVFTVSDRVVVLVPPGVVYRAVSRVGDMGRWSPENLGTTAGTADVPVAVGDSFVGRNKRGRVRWVTRCTVTAAEPGRRFAFRVDAIGLRTPRLRAPIASWEYRFEAADGGTLVTETWTDDRRAWPAPVANVFDRIATSGRTFAAFQARNIARTLRNLKRELESDAEAGGR
ncbi:SRPBCC family protein [Streptomyces sp. ACT015]|uniref:SRPBCC family protein n=1 Tax=Streptomyces sp. ACT015 TaxID=3134807 RepID=UPI003D1869FB